MLPDPTPNSSSGAWSGQSISITKEPLKCGHEGGLRTRFENGCPEPLSCRTGQAVRGSTPGGPGEPRSSLAWWAPTKAWGLFRKTCGSRPGRESGAVTLTVAVEGLVRDLDEALPLGWEAVMRGIHGLGQDFGHGKLCGGSSERAEVPSESSQAAGNQTAKPHLLFFFDRKSSPREV